MKSVVEYPGEQHPNEPLRKLIQLETPRGEQMRIRPDKGQGEEKSEVSTRGALSHDMRRNENQREVSTLGLDQDGLFWTKL